MRAALWFLLAATVFAAPKTKVKKKDLPQVDRVRPLVKLEPFSRAVYELDAHGRLYFNGSPMTLNEFDKSVLRHTEERGRHLRRTPGEKGYDEIGDIQASPVHVIFRVHADAPWRHVQWMMMMMQEQRAYKAEFLARDRRGKEGVVRAWIPLGKEAVDQFEIVADEDEDEDAGKPPPKQPGTVHVTLLASGKKARPFAGRQVPAPKSVSWAVGTRRIASFRDVEAAIAEGLAEAKRIVRKPRVEIRAAGTIPYGEVVRVLTLLHRRKVEHIDFGGTPIPDSKTKMAKTLPYPG